MRQRGGQGDRVLESEMRAFEEAVPDVDPVAPKDEAFAEFLRVVDSVPVSGILLDGRPLHMPGVHQKQGLVTTARTYGGSQIDREFVRRMLEYRSVDEILPHVTTVYTRGTGSGFVNRLRTLTSRKVPKTSKVLGLSRPKMILEFAKLLPVDVEKIKARAVTWHDDLAEQLDELRISARSGAGAPYWTSKPEALKPMLEAVLPMLHEAISDGTLPRLRAEQPELFLGEVKNKLDRYDLAKLDDKTRPYFSLPFHLQALFSMMSQPFTDALELFHSGRGVNAYGFSWAHGGGQKMLEWARGCRDIESGGKPRYCVYGDDVDIYYRTRGQLMRISPDFKQMDGSVDDDIISLAVDYVVEVLSLAWGENPFFRRVADLWKEYATNPPFLIHGERVYMKNQREGLMTGVVGTTFFDTAKSAFAYSAWVEQIQYGQRELLAPEQATAFFKQKFGLIIKEGTWKPTRVQEEPVPGRLVNENKFLGMMMMYRGGPIRTEPVPYLPDDEWTNLIMVPRDDPENFRRGRPKDSQLTVSRRWYDRARGYMVTGAFSNPLIRDWIHGFVNGLDPVSIVMNVQEGDGRGAPPDSAFLEDFQYPDSAGFPTEEWCENLYFSSDNQWPEAAWVHLIADVEERLESFRANYRPMAPKMAVLEVASGHPEKRGVVHAAQQVIEWEETENLVDFSYEVERMTPISGPESKPWRAQHPRSKIVNMSRGKAVGEAKRLPTQREVFWEFFETKVAPEPAPRLELGKIPSALWVDLVEISRQVGFKVYSTPVLAVRKIAASTGLSPERVESLARECGLYVLGRREKFVTKVRLISGEPFLQKQQAKQEAENKKAVGVVSEKTTPALRVLKHSEPAEPLTVLVVRNEHATPPPLSRTTRWRGSQSAANSLNELFQANQLVMKIHSRNVVKKGEPQQVETQLAWRHVKDPGRPFTWFMRALGGGTRQNVRDLYDAVVAYFDIHGLRSESHSGWTFDPCAAPKPPQLWADEVAGEERARLVDSRGKLFSVRGPYLYPERELGPWLAIDQGKAVIENVRWKQRRSETLAGFLRRTVKRLATHGLTVSAKTPKSQPIDLSPKKPKPE